MSLTPVYGPDFYFGSQSRYIIFKRNTLIYLKIQEFPRALPGYSLID
jgi:hypothetical protein